EDQTSVRSASAVTAATAPPAESAATTATARPRGLGLLDLDGPPVEVGAVETADCLLGFLRGRHLDEAEAARAPGIAIRDHTGGFHGAGSREGLAKPLIGRRERETSYEQFDRHGGNSFRGEGSTQHI